ncbi:hypothetical protein DL93DRAFT_2162625 [Clavulina sp. PMI_390]|nr:hypothetical protein DL93DRAFT_2162625 [Clavulina sp. PMI_390]
MSRAGHAGMRIYALPLAKARPGRPALVYYLTSLPPKTELKDDAKTESRASKLVKRGQQKLAETWTSWGAKEGGWQKMVYDFGQRAQANVDFEELALRSINPTMGPKAISNSEGQKSGQDVKQQLRDDVSLRYPSLFHSAVQDDPLPHLTKHVLHHEPKHRKKFWTYVAIAPLTAPFIIVPVIPNIPFFFVAWRAWSNYKASKASGYLRSLISASMIRPQLDTILDEQYRLSAATNMHSTISASSSPSASPQPTTTTTSQTTPPSTESSSAEAESAVLLHERSVPSLVSALQLPPETSSELVHAIRQVRTRLGLPNHKQSSKPAPAKENDKEGEKEKQ